MNTPRQVVAAAFDALRANDWKRVASLCDPLSLDAFKMEMLEEFGDRFSEPDPEQSTSQAEPIQLDDEQFVEYMKYLHPDSMMKVEFPQLSTMHDLRRMEAVDAFASWLEGQAFCRREFGRSAEEAWKRDTLSTSEAESCGNLVHYPVYAIVGCVFDSMDIAHVVYRPEKSPADLYADVYPTWLAAWPAEYRDFMNAMHHRGIPMLITCRKQGDSTWRVVANRRFTLFGSLQVVEFSREE